MQLTTATTARWFLKRRGLALGIASSGIGLGTLVLVPTVERLIAQFGWSKTYIIIGIATWAIMVTCALLLRREPRQMGCQPYGAETIPEAAANLKVTAQDNAARSGVNLGRVVSRKPLVMLVSIHFVIMFCFQMTLVHLVNYATDLGITPVVAATLISTIGIGSIAGRLLMGITSDKIGSANALIICCTMLAVSLIFLILARDLWMFYLFGIIFGFAYGGEIPQVPSLIGRFFGLQKASALVGTVLLGSAAGGALGPWIAGYIFDATHSYQPAFFIAFAASLLAIVITLVLKKEVSRTGGS